MTTLRHSGIVVFDIERAIKFYQTYFGFKLISKKILSGDYVETLFNTKDIKLTYAKMRAKGDRTLLELWHFWKPIDQGSGLNHISLTVKDLDSLYKKLKTEEKLTFFSEPTLSPENNAKVCFCRDTEGNLIELCEISE